MSQIDDFYSSNTIWLFMFSYLCCVNYYYNRIDDSVIKKAKDYIICFNKKINDESDKYFEVLQNYFTYSEDMDYVKEIGEVFLRNFEYIQEGIRLSKFDSSFCYSVLVGKYIGLLNNYSIGIYVKDKEKNIRQRKG